MLAKSMESFLGQVEIHSKTLTLLQKSVKQTNQIETIQRYLLKFLQKIMHSLQICIHIPDS